MLQPTMTAAMCPRAARLIPLTMGLLIAVLGARARATEFALSPAESYFTLGGVATGDQGQLRPIQEQSAGSLTAALSGYLKLADWGVGLRLADGLLIPQSQAGDFLPAGAAPDVAGKADQILGTETGYVAVRESRAHLSGLLLESATPGSYSSDGTRLQYRSSAVDSVVPIYWGPAREAWNLSMQNLHLGSATFTNQGSTYRVEIPFNGLANVPFGQFVTADLEFSGQLVAYAEIASGGLTPEVADGGFEWHHDWMLSASPGSTAELKKLGPVVADPAQHGEYVAAMSVTDGSATAWQWLLLSGTLQPDTKYAVSFDVRSFAASGSAVEDVVSSMAFFTLGFGAVTDFANRIGGFYKSDLVGQGEEDWSRHTIVFDTTGLTPEQLAQRLNLVLQGQSTNPTKPGTVLFDNVQVTVVPEPASACLLTLGVAGAAIAARLRKRSKTPR